MILNQTIVSDVARLHLDFILCDDSLHLCLTSDTHWEQILNLWPQYININIYIYIYIYICIYIRSPATLLGTPVQ